MSEHTERTMLDRIRRTWGADGNQPRYVVAEHVNNGAGFSYGRTLDAIVFDTWPSKGLLLHGLEVKVSTSDLRRELQDTRKAGAFFPYLDHFSVVAPQNVIAAARAEVPKRWGIYQPTDDGRLRAVRKPLMLHDDGQRETLDRSLMAAFARALVQRSLSREAEEAAYSRGESEATKRAAFEIEQAKRSAEGIVASAKAFEEASGIKIDQWNGGSVGEALAAFQKLRGRGYLGGLPVEKAQRLAEDIATLADELATLKAFLNSDDEVA